MKLVLICERQFMNIETIRLLPLQSSRVGGIGAWNRRRESGETSKFKPSPSSPNGGIWGNIKIKPEPSAPFSTHLDSENVCESTPRYENFVLSAAHADQRSDVRIGLPEPAHQSFRVNLELQCEERTLPQIPIIPQLP